MKGSNDLKTLKERYNELSSGNNALSIAQQQERLSLLRLIKDKELNLRRKEPALQSPTSTRVSAQLGEEKLYLSSMKSEPGRRVSGYNLAFFVSNDDLLSDPGVISEVNYEEEINPCSDLSDSCSDRSGFS